MKLHPGKVLSEVLLVYRIEPKQLAVLSGIPESTILRLLRCEISVDGKIAKGLGAALPHQEELWLALQAHYDSRRADLAGGIREELAEQFAAVARDMGYNPDIEVLNGMMRGFSPAFIEHLALVPRKDRPEIFRAAIASRVKKRGGT